MYASTDSAHHICQYFASVSLSSHSDIAGTLGMYLYCFRGVGELE